MGRVKPISRRAVLRGLGGAALSLPVLQIMLNSHGDALAAGEPIPKRYGVWYFGTVLGNMYEQQHPNIGATLLPDGEGFGYDLKSALAPLADHGNISEEIALISEMRIMPEFTGGSNNNFHHDMIAPLLAGRRNEDSDIGGGVHVRGETSDEIVARAIGGDTTFSNLAYSVQASAYGKSGHNHSVMSFKPSQGNERAEPNIPQRSPQAAFDSLFSTLAPEDPAQAALHEYRLRTRLSVIDLVGDNIETLTPKLGRADSERLERHLDEVRDLERRVDAAPPDLTGGCTKPDDPGPDPAIGGDGTHSGSGQQVNYGEDDGYSGEDERARVFCDLLHMAYVCDLTRVSTLMLCETASWMNVAPLTTSGHVASVHHLGHGSQFGTIAISEFLAWGHKHFAYFVAKLRDTPVGDGRLLDHCAIVMTYEGGAQNDNYGGLSPHQHRRRIALVAGRAGGLQTGQHIVAFERPPAEVLVTAMRAVGVDEPLGEINTTIPGLLP